MFPTCLFVAAVIGGIDGFGIFYSVEAAGEVQIKLALGSLYIRCLATMLLGSNINISPRD